MATSRTRALLPALVSLGLLSAAEAQGGTYGKINQSDWQQSATGLPTYVNMYSFVPTKVATKPPVVVYCHHCQGNAASSHSSMAALETLADTNGFLIIYPEATGENCWDAGSKRSLKHDGGGDTGAIVQMVKYYLSKYTGDADRVYVAGDSSGGIMTEALLGVYPDIFMAGISIMGVPCGCWGQSDYNDVTGSGSTAQWCGSCSGGTVSKTGQEWGDLVRSYFPDYTGHRPRLQHWHGASDTTLNYKNVAEDIKEWTNLLSLSETPTGTEQNTPKSGTTHQYWKNSCYTVYETFVLANTGHAVSLDGGTVAKYFGIDTAGGQDPETAACGASAVPGGAGGTSTGGDGGAGGGSAGAGGSSGATTGGSGGATGTTSASAGAGGATGATTGTTGSGGKGSGGATGSSAVGSAGSKGSGGTSGSGASGSGGGTSDGTKGAAGATTSGSATGGKSGSGGGSASGTSISGSAGSTSGSSAAGSDSSSGCGCRVGSRGESSKVGLAALLLLASALLSRRRR